MLRPAGCTILAILGCLIIIALKHCRVCISNLELSSHPFVPLLWLTGESLAASLELWIENMLEKRLKKSFSPCGEVGEWLAIGESYSGVCVCVC